MTGVATVVAFGVAVTLEASAVALAWSQVRRVEDARLGELASLTRRIKALPLADRVAALAERAAPDSWAGELASELLEASPDGPAAQRPLVNLALVDLDHLLGERRSLPRAGAKLALLAGGLALVVAFLDRAPSAVLAANLGLAAAGAAVCVAAGKRAGDAEAARRADVDALVTALLGGRGVPPTSPRRRAS